jgi:hypothetical protein
LLGDYIEFINIIFKIRNAVHFTYHVLGLSSRGVIESTPELPGAEGTLHASLWSKHTAHASVLLLSNLFNGDRYSCCLLLYKRKEEQINTCVKHTGLSRAGSAAAATSSEESRHMFA